MNFRDLLFTLGLISSVILAAYPDFYLPSLAIGFSVFFLLIYYAVRGRWQAVPLIILAAVSLACRLAFPVAVPAWLSALIVIFILVFAVLLYASPVPRLPKPSGKHPIGIKHLSIPGERELVVYLWYPAAQANGRGRPFLNAGEARAISQGFKAIGSPGFLNNHLRLSATNSVQNAPPASGKYPLIIFNHGGGLYPKQNTSLMEELASHGFVCASVGHPGESIGLLNVDGDEILIKPETLQKMVGSDEFQTDNLKFLMEKDPSKRGLAFKKLSSHRDNGLTALTQAWAADSLKVADLFRSQDPTHIPQEIRNITDPSKLAYSGMSLGGATATLCCHLDRNAGAGVNLDGFNWSFEKATAALQVPFLQCYADPNSLLASAKQKTGIDYAPFKLSANLPMHNDVYFYGANLTPYGLIFPGIAHMAFTDNALSARPGFKNMLGLGPAASQTFVRDLNQLVRLFLSESLKSQDGDGSLEMMIDELQSQGVLIRQKMPEPTTIH